MEGWGRGASAQRGGLRGEGPEPLWEAHVKARIAAQSPWQSRIDGFIHQFQDRQTDSTGVKVGADSGRTYTVLYSNPSTSYTSPPFSAVVRCTMGWSRVQSRAANPAGTTLRGGALRLRRSCTHTLISLAHVAHSNI